MAVGTAATAAAAGATPIPFSDAVAIVPIQVGMIETVSVIFGLDLSTGFLTTLVTASPGSTSGTLVGRAVVGSLLKMIPEIGSVVGGKKAGSRESGSPVDSGGDRFGAERAADGYGRSFLSRLINTASYRSC